MEKLKIKISREHGRVILPTKTEGNAGYDLYADPLWFDKTHGDILVIHTNETAMIPTGIRTVYDKNWYIQIQERGSTGVRAMKYGAGVLDSIYRGIHNVVITNCNNKPIILFDPNKVDEDLLSRIGIAYPINKGIAQFMLLPVPETEFEEVTPEEILSHVTDRMEGKLGSSNK